MIYVMSAACAIGCLTNVLCIVTHQPSELHLNLVAAIVCGLASLILLAAGLTK